MIFAHNTAVQDTIKFTLFKLIYAKEPVLPTDMQKNQSMSSNDTAQTIQNIQEVRELAKQKIKSKQEKDKKRYDRKHRHVEFQASDQVRIYTDRKNREK